MKIHVLANDGSQLGVTPNTIYGDSWQVGVGGAELAMLTIMEKWTQKGYDVTFYNNPRGGDDSKLKQRPKSAFNPQENRDVLIAYRSPNFKIRYAKADKKLWFSTDQYAGANTDFGGFSTLVDATICISPRHLDYFKKTYGITNAQFIDLPVREWDYEGKEIEKVPYRMLFASVPHRGLSTLAEVYPKIKKAVPEASLVITSDYRLWGSPNPNNQDHRRKFMGMDGVDFIGAVPRDRLIEEQLKAQLMPYPCVYDELFCIAVAEAMYAGCYPVTSNVGALATTNMGRIVPGTPVPMWQNEYTFDESWRSSFTNAVIEMLKDQDNLRFWSDSVRDRARNRFNLDLIMNKWESVLRD